MTYIHPTTGKEITLNRQQLTVCDRLENAAQDRVSGSPTGQILMGLGALGGGLGILSLSLPVAALLAAPFWYRAIKQSWLNGQSAAYVRQHGNFAHLLNESELVQMAKAIGKETVAEQILEAATDGQEISASARRFMHLAGTEVSNLTLDNLFKEYAAADAELQSIDEAVEAVTTTVDAVATPITETESVDLSKRPMDIAAFMAKKPKPTLISAVPRVGKGVVLAQAWRQFKAENPNGTVWVIQPKPHPDETGYWEGCDRFWGYMIEEYDAGDRAELAESLTQFVQDWRRQAQRPSILIFDEAIKLEACLPKWYKQVLIPTVKVESSSGETDRRYLWLVTQSPLVSDLGLTGGNRSGLRLLALETPESSEHLRSIQKSFGSVPDAAGSVYDASTSPTNAIFYHSDIGDWYPMPKYPVYQSSQGQTKAVSSAPSSEATELLADLKDSPPLNLPESPSGPVYSTLKRLKRLGVAQKDVYPLFGITKGGNEGYEAFKGLWDGINV